MSRYQSDLKKEAVVANFLDENEFYENLILDSSSYKRNMDTNLQHEGIDVVITNAKGKEQYIDEKCALYWINWNIRTFAFEVDYLKDNSFRQGWLYDSNKKTDWYLLMWIEAENDKDKDRKVLAQTLTESMITKLECFMVKRERIVNYLESVSLDQNTAQNIIKDMRGNSEVKRDYIPDKNISFHVSKEDYSEEPANILINKTKLYELADYVCNVYPGSIDWIKRPGK